MRKEFKNGNFEVKIGSVLDYVGFKTQRIVVKEITTESFNKEHNNISNASIIAECGLKIKLNSDKLRKLIFIA